MPERSKFIIDLYQEHIDAINKSLREQGYGDLKGAARYPVPAFHALGSLIMGLNGSHAEKEANGTALQSVDARLDGAPATQGFIMAAAREIFGSPDYRIEPVDVEVGLLKVFRKRSTPYVHFTVGPEDHKRDPR